jgi:hypothetical protein
LGNGKFEEVSEKLGVKTNRWALASGAADLNEDGFTDLFIANDYGVSELFFNENGKRFVDVGERTGVGFAPKSGMNASFGDVLNQGKFAIYVSTCWRKCLKQTISTSRFLQKSKIATIFSRKSITGFIEAEILKKPNRQNPSYNSLKV